MQHKAVVATSVAIGLSLALGFTASAQSNPDTVPGRVMEKTIDTYEKLPSADATTRRFSFGGLVGRTSGLTSRILITRNTLGSGPFEHRALDINLSFNGAGFILMTTHVTAERTVEDSPLFFYIGPGWSFGVEDEVVSWGPSANIGVYFIEQRYEVFMQLMPRMDIVPDLYGQIGAAIGMRIIF